MVHEPWYKYRNNHSGAHAQFELSDYLPTYLLLGGRSARVGLRYGDPA